MDKKPRGGDGLTSGNLSVLIPWKSVEGAWQQDFFHPCVLQCTKSPWLCNISLRHGRESSHHIWWSIHFGEIGDLF